MNLTDSQNLLRRFTAVVRQSWLRAVKLADADRAKAVVAAERFADDLIRLSIQAGYAEARHLRTGVFDPTLSADRFRIERSGLVARFMADVNRAFPGASVGLSSRQRRDLRTFALTLEASALDAIDFGDPSLFTSKEQRTQVKRLERAMLTQRARTVGSTEALAALSLGVDVSVTQTEDLTGDSIPRTWQTSADEKVRSSHKTMNGQTRVMGVPFLTGNGVSIMRPGDPNAPVSERANCRCILTTGT